MNVCIDVGNSTIGIGVFENNILVERMVVNTDPNFTEEQFYQLFKRPINYIKEGKGHIDNIIFSSVVPQVNLPIINALKELTNLDPILIGPGTKTGLAIKVDNPLEIGNDLIADLNKLDGDYALRDDETGELLVTVRYGGQIAVKFDNIKTLEKGTFKKIDEFKSFSTDFGYCKGFKPNFRPIEGNVENVEIKPEIIYITADSEENLLKLRDYLTDKIKEIDPDFLVEFTRFFDE